MWVWVLRRLFNIMLLLWVEVSFGWLVILCVVGGVIRELARFLQLDGSGRVMFEGPKLDFRFRIWVSE